MIMFRIGHTLALSCLMIAGTAATLNAQERVAITSATNRLIISQVGNGITTTPWITVLVTPYDTSSGGDKALIVQTSSITGIFSADIRLSQFTLLLENAGIQARVLIDCAPPTCVSTSNTVPANTLATPGVITLDQAFHFLLQVDSGSFNVALDETAGARSFNFYKVGISKSHNHTVQFQVRFKADAFSTANGPILDAVAAGIGKRTMIVDMVKLNQED